MILYLFFLLILFLGIKSVGLGFQIHIFFGSLGGVLLGFFLGNYQSRYSRKDKYYLIILITALGAFANYFKWEDMNKIGALFIYFLIILYIIFMDYLLKSFDQKYFKDI
jgi:hypothetical protein